MGRWNKNENEMTKEAIKENDRILKVIDEVKQKSPEFRQHLFGRMKADCKYAIQWGDFKQMYMMESVKGQIAVMRALHNSLPAGTLTTTMAEIDTLESRLYAAEKFKTEKAAVPNPGDKMTFPARDLVFYPEKGGTDCAEFYEVENVNGEVYVNGDDGRKSIPFDQFTFQDQKHMMDALRERYVEKAVAPKRYDKNERYNTAVQQVEKFRRETGIKLKISKESEGFPLHIIHSSPVISVEGSSVTSLPAHLRTGHLDVSGCKSLTALPEDLAVHGDLDIENTSIKELPADLYVDGDIFLHGSKVTDIPDNALCTGKVFGLPYNRLERMSGKDGVIDMKEQSVPSVEIEYDGKTIPVDRIKLKNDRIYITSSAIDHDIDVRKYGYEGYKDINKVEDLICNLWENYKNKNNLSVNSPSDAKHHIPVQDEKTREKQLIKDFANITGYVVDTIVYHGKPFINGPVEISGVEIEDMPKNLIINGNLLIEDSEILHGLPKGMVVYGDMTWKNVHIPAPLPVDLFVEGKIEGIDEHALKHWKCRQEVQKQYDRVDKMEKSNPKAVELMTDHRRFPFVHDKPVMKFDRPVVLDNGLEYTHFVFAKDSDGTGSLRLHGANAPTVLRHINTFKDDETGIILGELNASINQAEYLGKKMKVVGDIFKPEVLRDMMKEEPWIKDYALQPRNTLTMGEKNKVAECFIGKAAKGAYISDHTVSEVLNFIRSEIIGDIIKERVRDGGTKAFTSEQYDTLEKGLQSYNSPLLDMSKPESRAMILNNHWENCQKTFDKERIPAEWREDAKAELDGFAGGIRREGEQLKR